MPFNFVDSKFQSGLRIVGSSSSGNPGGSGGSNNWEAITTNWEVLSTNWEALT
jgi:hypothetical protein